MGRVIYIRNPKSGSNFRTIGGGSSSPKPKKSSGGGASAGQGTSATTPEWTVQGSSVIHASGAIYANTSFWANRNRGNKPPAIPKKKEVGKITERRERNGVRLMNEPDWISAISLTGIGALPSPRFIDASTARFLRGHGLGPKWWRPNPESE